MSLGSFVLDGVLQRDDTRLLVDPSAGQLQLEPPRRSLGRQQWDSLAQQDGNHRDFDGIHLPSRQEAAEELPATEEPDILARLRPKLGQRSFWCLGDYGYVRIVLLTERPREDHRLSTAPCPSHALERPTSHKE